MQTYSRGPAKSMRLNFSCRTNSTSTGSMSATAEVLLAAMVVTRWEVRRWWAVGEVASCRGDAVVRVETGRMNAAGAGWENDWDWRTGRSRLGSGDECLEVEVQAFCDDEREDLVEREHSQGPLLH